MPTPIKQKPTDSNKAKPGSVLSEAMPVGDIEDDFIKIVIYGQNRVGKTTLACKFPKPLLLVAFEPAKTGGAKSVKAMPGIDYLKITSTAKAGALAKELREHGKYKTVVLDTATSLQDLVLQELLDLPEVPEMLSWGLVSPDQYRERSEKTRELLRPYLNLNTHTVVIAKERDHNREKGMDKPTILSSFRLESYFASDLGGATVGWLHDACDYICRLYLDKETKTVKRKVKYGNTEKEVTEEVETGEIVRRLRTMYHPNFAAGFRSERPDTIPEYIEDPTFEKIHELIRGE